jgi:molecular chaperone DnaK
MANTNRIYGIDLGTTYSCISYLDENNRPVVIAGDNNRLVTPSVVYFEPNNVIVGETAKEYARVEPDRTVALVKRYMGDSTWKKDISGTKYRPEEISSYILLKLKKAAEDALGDEVTDVVITVPAYFSSAERTATEQAGQLAGLKVHDLIPEPMAAAIAYAVNEVEDQTVMVYDLGGGTFDITVLNVSQGNRVAVICTDGIHALGGQDWDDRIVNHLAEVWQQENGYETHPLDDPQTAQDLNSAAENAKINLSNREQVPITVQHGAGRTRVELTREKFDELTADLLTRTIDLTKKILEVAKSKGHAQLDKVLLVGGSTYMPQVKGRLATEVPGIPIEAFDPDQCVAKGAAIYGSNIQIREAYAQAIADTLGEDVSLSDVDALPAEQKDRIAQEALKNLPGNITLAALEDGRTQEIVNACSKNFGVIILLSEGGDGIQWMIKKNDQVPANKGDQFATVNDNQSSAKIQIVEGNGDDFEDVEHLPEGEDSLPSYAKKIGNMQLELPPNLPKGSPFTITYSLSNDGGRLRAEGQEDTGGTKCETEIDEVGALTPEEISSRIGAMAVT